MINARRSPDGQRLAFRRDDLTVTESAFPWEDSAGGRYTEADVRDWPEMVPQETFLKSLEVTKISLELVNEFGRRAQETEQKLTTVRESVAAALLNLIGNEE